MLTRRGLAFVLTLIIPGLAHADAVGPEPASCPPGSTPATAHSGPYCAPGPDCSGPDDRSCAAGSACTAVMQCIETRACGGRTFPDAAPCTLEHVVGPCASDGTCATGTCRARDVCSIGGSTGGGETGGCGCSAAGARRSLAPGLALAALALAVRRRSPSARGRRR